MTTPFTTVLFDLDGTLLDTAPDLGYALNQLLRLHGSEPLPQESIRPVVSRGTPGLLKLAFGIEPAHPDYGGLRETFLALYRDHLCVLTQPFADAFHLIQTLHDRQLAWGIVTNKPQFLTDVLLKQIPFPVFPPCVVCGDTVVDGQPLQRKPHAQPILHACNTLGVNPSDTLFVGDVHNDILAGKNAGTKTAVALYGYIEAGDNPHDWQADYIFSTLSQLIELLQR